MEAARIFRCGARLGVRSKLYFTFVADIGAVTVMKLPTYVYEFIQHLRLSLSPALGVTQVELC